MTRIDELTLKQLDGALTDAESAELAVLLADPAGRAGHIALLDLEIALRGLRADLDLVGPTLERVNEALAERTTAAVMTEIAALPRPVWASARRRSARWVILGGLAAVVVAVLSVGLWPGGDIPAPIGPDPTDIPATFATLTRVFGIVELLTPGGDVMPAESGRRIVPGDSLRTVGEDSFAEVEFPDHTLVELEPDTTVRLRASSAAGAGWRVVLGEGQLKADVPDRPNGRPMLVSTSAADVRTRGGSFLVASASPESARVEPRRGSVEVATIVAPRPVSVGVGGSAVVRSGLERVTVEEYPRVNATPRRTLAPEAYPSVRDAVFAPNGRDVWAATGRTLVLWTGDGGTADIPYLPKKGGDTVAAVFTPDRTALVTSRAEKEDGVAVRAIPDAEQRASMAARFPESRFAAVAPAGVWVATAGSRTTPQRVTVWDGSTGVERFSRDADAAINCLAAAPSGRALAVGTTDPGKGPHNKIVLFDPVTGERRFALPTQRKAVSALAFSADGRYLAAGFTGLVQIWDTRTRDLVRTITGFERVVACLAFSPDGTRLAGGTQDGQVWVWSARTGNPVQRIETGGRVVRAIDFSPNGTALLTAASKAPVAIWDVVPESSADRDEQ